MMYTRGDLRNWIEAVLGRGGLRVDEIYVISVQLKGAPEFKKNDLGSIFSCETPILNSGVRASASCGQ